MKTTTHKLTLKTTALIAAVGTTLYTLFVLMLQALFGNQITWLNFCEHPQICNAWFLSFHSILLLSWAVFSLGIIRDGEHFPPINKWVRYALLVLAIGLILIIPFSYYSIFRYAYSYHSHIVVRCTLGVIYSILLWCLYTHTLSTNIFTSSADALALPDTMPSRNPRWLRFVCWVVFVSALLVWLGFVVAIAIYAVGVFGDDIHYICTAREMCYRVNSGCNLLFHFVPILFCLLVFLQPIINRRSGDKPITTQPQKNNIPIDGNITL